jgi:hypothetical protein
MTILDLKKQIGLNVFTVDMIKSILQKEYEQPILKINAMIKKGELLRLKRGVYAFSADYRNHPLNLIATANILHKPSYVSYEYALSYHGLIPERVYTVTSATTYCSQEYTTELGHFSYTKIPSKAYSIGIEWKFDERDGGYMLATPEKALCDKIYADKRISNISKNEMAQYLEEDLRIEWENLKELDSKLIWRISIAYSSNELQSIAAIINKRGKNG